MIEDEKRAQLQCQFPATLDTVLRRNNDDVSYIAKLSLLTSKHLAFSDTQLLDSRGLRALFRKPRVREFLKTPDLDAVTPIVACMRTTRSFEDVLKNMLIEREKPMLFSSLSDNLNEEIIEKYARRRSNTLGAFYDLCAKSGEDFACHVKNLEDVFQNGSVSRMQWGKFKRAYPELVAEAIGKEKGRVERWINHLVSSKDYEEKYVSGAKKQQQLCELIEETIQQEGLDRSVLYRKINAFKAHDSIKDLVRRQILDSPYNDGFAEANCCHVIRGDEYQSISLLEGAPEVNDKVSRLTTEYLDRVKILPLNFERIPFETVREIRSTTIFRDSLNVLCNPVQGNRIRFLTEYLPFLAGKLGQVPKGAEKITIQIKKVLVGGDIREVFVDFAVEDALSFLPRMGSFVVSELVKKVPLVGEAAAWILERVIDKRRRRQERELKHIVALRALKGEQEVARNV